MKNFDDLFRSELAEHAETPPSRVWDNLEKRLNANAAGGKTPFGKGWYWMVGVASVAVVLGGLGWSMVNRDAAPAAAPVAMATETTTAPAMEEPATMPEAPATNNAGRHMPAAYRHANSNGQAAEHDAEEVSAYGNAAATGTKLHSYDDFDERAIASSGKQLAPLNSDEEHAANGYKVNKIRKHRLVAAEMVPLSQQQPVYAAGNIETAKPVEVQKTAVKTSRLVRTVAANQPPKKAVVFVNETDKKGKVPETVAEAPATPAAETATAVSAPVATSPLPVPAGTATAAKSKPASEITLPVKPTTGGSEPAKADSQNKQENANSATGDDKKGLFGIFKKKKNK